MPPLSRPPFNGSLFASTSLTDSMAPPFTITDLDATYQAYATNLTTTSDIALLDFGITPALVPSVSAPVTLTLAVTVANRSHGLAAAPVTVDFYAGGEPGQRGRVDCKRDAGVGRLRRCTGADRCMAAADAGSLCRRRPSWLWRAADGGDAVADRAEAVFLFVAHELYLPAVSGSLPSPRR